MIVSKRAYEKLEGSCVLLYTKLVEWQDAYEDLASKYNNLTAHRAKNDFSAEDISRLIRLCHPDKHANSKAANEMTAKLLSIKSNQGLSK